ncbi:hypothetical protein LPW26_06100 [Rhodopseudomonas sp. HC1]|uniref:hypothetical protein n=1 Tax=Rhodopseudomonas infernalis TaxID=2897386 RepID=UPI001EE86CC4|nr:hypothetical protein [Rhodopseudomonas infernalis]MCG6204199.1 hypothetical protein [Rhodopseudomonas infernalis]
MSDTFTVGPDGSRLRVLVKPIEAHGERKIELIRLRQPGYREIMSFGDPAAMIVLQNAMLPHEDMGIIEKYIAALATDDAGNKIDPGLLGQVDYRDALALKDAVLDFFKPAALTSSSKPPTS